jgi:hypothetical protein
MFVLLERLCQLTRADCAVVPLQNLTKSIRNINYLCRYNLHHVSARHEVGGARWPTRVVLLLSVRPHRRATECGAAATPTMPPANDIAQRTSKPFKIRRRVKTNTY